jgi:hypothetical protein
MGGEGRRWNCLIKRIYFISTHLGSNVNGEEDAEEDHGTRDGDSDDDIKGGLSPRGDAHPGNLQILGTGMESTTSSRPLFYFLPYYIHLMGKAKASSNMGRILNSIESCIMGWKEYISKHNVYLDT